MGREEHSREDEKKTSEKGVDAKAFLPFFNLTETINICKGRERRRRDRREIATKYVRA